MLVERFLAVFVLLGTWTTTAIKAPAVITLTDANFEATVLNSKESWILDFYAPWCGHCKKLEPVFEEVAQELLGKYKLGKLDVTSNKATQKKYKIRGFPTLKFFRGGEMRPYKGNRNVKGFLDFAKEMSKPAVSDIGLKTLKQWLVSPNEAPYPVAVVDLQEDRATSKNFEMTAFALQGTMSFARPSGPDELQRMLIHLGVTPGIYVVTNGLPPSKAPNPGKSKALRKFCAGRVLPLVSEMGPSNFEDVTKSGKLTAIAVVDADDKATAAYRESIKAVAQKMHSRFTFGVLDGIQWSTYVTRFGFDVSRLPGLFVFDGPEENYYISEFVTDPLGNDHEAPEGAELVAALSSFLNDVDEGKIAAKSLMSWYNPNRLMKKIDLYFAEYDDTYVMIGMTVFMLLFTGVTIAGCSYCVGQDSIDDYPEPEPTVAVDSGTTHQAAAAPAPVEKDSASKKED